MKEEGKWLKTAHIRRNALAYIFSGLELSGGSPSSCLQVLIFE